MCRSYITTDLLIDVPSGEYEYALATNNGEVASDYEYVVGPGIQRVSFRRAIPNDGQLLRVSLSNFRSSYLSLPTVACLTPFG
jgi:hypothetical protein